MFLLSSFAWMTRGLRPLDPLGGGEAIVWGRADMGMSVP